MKIAVSRHALTTVCNGVELTAGNNTLSYRGQRAKVKETGPNAIMLNKLPAMEYF